MNKIQTIIKNIEVELNLYKNNEAIKNELNAFLERINTFVVNPPEDILNDFMRANISCYDILLNDAKTAKEKRVYNFMINFLVSNR
jgi:hypothetical protein